MRTFISLKNIEIFGEILFKEGDRIEFVDDSTKHVITANNFSMDLTLDTISKDSRFKELQELDFSINEITDEQEMEVKRFRIQLDVTTTQKKLREIEIFMRKTLEKML